MQMSYIRVFYLIKNLLYVFNRQNIFCSMFVVELHYNRIEFFLKTTY